MDFVKEITAELKLDEKGVAAAIALFDDDATVPFVARYRKEKTGGLDEVQLTDIRDHLGFLRKLEERKGTILKTIESQGKLTDQLKEKIENCLDQAILEDLYLPYKPKRKTRASAAMEKGLEPLADLIWEQKEIEKDVNEIAGALVNEEKGVPDIESAWTGARDIVAQRVSENARLRGKLRLLFLEKGLVTAKIKKGKESQGAKYRDYFDFSEPVKTIPGHRVLAVRRAEAEGILTTRVLVDRELALSDVKGEVVKEEGGPLADHLLAACEDGYDRLLKPSMEGAARNELRKRADKEAIAVFVKNLRRLLMSPPLGGKWVLAVDPGIRTGCKVVALDDKGDLLAQTVIYPMAAQHEKEKAAKIIEQYCKRYRIEAIAIGNGTGGRETEKFFRSMERDLINDADIILVNEAGASIYSAGDIARKEFPDQDITVRGAISIGRRLQDPLSELVKIEPKSIGVGQYQHDVDQDRLKGSLDDVVVSCVNGVGVELNNASHTLLSYVSGINTTQAGAIVEFRKKNGLFKNRKQIVDVPRIGPKAFEQAAGFLRIRNGENALDASAVHPERYELVEQIAKDNDMEIKDLVGDPGLKDRVDLSKYISDDVGEPTLKDILDELAKPGRDPRPKLAPVRFNPDVTELKDLREGLVLDGVVTNVTNFGAFVDIGVHQDGLVHVSELSHEYIQDPSKAVSVQDRVKVKVLEVDQARNRVSLSIKQTTEPPARAERADYKPFPKRERSQGGGNRKERYKGRPPRRNDRYEGKGQYRKGGQKRQGGQNRGGGITSNPFAALAMKDGKIVLSDNKKSNKKKKK